MLDKIDKKVIFEFGRGEEILFLSRGGLPEQLSSIRCWGPRFLLFSISQFFLTAWLLLQEKLAKGEGSYHSARNIFEFREIEERKVKKVWFPTFCINFRELNLNPKESLTHPDEKKEVRHLFIRVFKSKFDYLAKQ